MSTQAEEFSASPTPTPQPLIPMLPSIADVDDAYRALGTLTSDIDMLEIVVKRFVTAPDVTLRDENGVFDEALYNASAEVSHAAMVARSHHADPAIFARLFAFVGDLEMDLDEMRSYAERLRADLLHGYRDFVIESYYSDAEGRAA